jgi:hypothetical protein
MSTLFIPCNGSVPAIKIGNLQYVSGGYPTQAILASEVLYAFPTTTKYQGAPYACFLVAVGLGNTAPVLYYFDCTTISAFTTFLSGASVTHNLATYTKAIRLNGQKTFTPPISVLINQVLISNQGYNPKSNVSSFTIASLSKTAYQTLIDTLGNNVSAGATAATASLAVPIAASPANGDTLKAYINGVQIGSTYTVTGSPAQSAVKTAIDALFNSNSLGFTFVGTLATNVDTLAGTAPTTGTFYNGYVVSFVPTGTTFGSSTVTATFASGV